MSVYRLTRDDGTELRLSGSIWEDALELGFLYGWRPVGTETPRTEAWRCRRDPARVSTWDSRDYFSHESQHVGEVDAHSLARAIQRALLQIPDCGSERERSSVSDGKEADSPVPTRASTIAAGMSSPRKNQMRDFAAFASDGGFTIGSVAER
jgi:hypothetical protein